MSGRLGGISQEKEADEDVQKVTDQVQISWSENPLKLYRSRTHTLLILRFELLWKRKKEGSSTSLQQSSTVHKWWLESITSLRY